MTQITCRKVRHETEAEALFQVHRHKVDKKENKKILNKLNVYWCRPCGSFHVGHNRLKGKQYAHV